MAFLSKVLVLIMVSAAALLTLTAASSFAADQSPITDPTRVQTGKKRLPKASDFVELEGSDDGASDSELGGKSKKDAVTSNEQVLTGTVRVLRKITHTEAFFKDINDSYIIPSGNSYYSIYTAFNESQKKGTAVSFRANTKSRRVLSIEDAPEKPGGEGNSGIGSGKSTSGSK